MNLGVTSVFPSSRTDEEWARAKCPDWKGQALDGDALSKRQAHLEQRPSHFKINPALTDNKARLWLWTFKSNLPVLGLTEKTSSEGEPPAVAWETKLPGMWV